MHARSLTLSLSLHPNSSVFFTDTRTCVCVWVVAVGWDKGGNVSYLAVVVIITLFIDASQKEYLYQKCWRRYIFSTYRRALTLINKESVIFKGR